MYTVFLMRLLKPGESLACQTNLGGHDALQDQRDRHELAELVESKPDLRAANHDESKIDPNKVVELDPIQQLRWCETIGKQNPPNVQSQPTQPREMQNQPKTRHQQPLDLRSDQREVQGLRRPEQPVQQHRQCSGQVRAPREARAHLFGKGWSQSRTQRQGSHSCTVIFPEPRAEFHSPPGSWQFVPNSAGWSHTMPNPDAALGGQQASWHKCPAAKTKGTDKYGSKQNARQRTTRLTRGKPPAELSNSFECRGPKDRTHEPKELSCRPQLWFHLTSDEHTHIYIIPLGFLT